MMKNTNNKKYIFIYNSIFNNHENYKNLDNIRDLFQKIKSNKKEREQWNIEINQTHQKKNRGINDDYVEIFKKYNHKAAKFNFKWI